MYVASVWRTVRRSDVNVSSFLNPNFLFISYTVSDNLISNLNLYFEWRISYWQKSWEFQRKHFSWQCVNIMPMWIAKTLWSAIVRNVPPTLLTMIVLAYVSNINTCTCISSPEPKAQGSFYEQSLLTSSLWILECVATFVSENSHFKSCNEINIWSFQIYLFK